MNKISSWASFERNLLLGHVIIGARKLLAPRGNDSIKQSTWNIFIALINFPLNNTQTQGHVN